MKATGNAILYYMAQKLYPDEDPDDLINPEYKNKKFVLANFEAGENVALYKNMEDLQQSSSATFPFSAFNWAEEELKIDTKSHLQVSGKIFDTSSQSYIQAIPAYWNIPMIHFFSNAHDYFRARQLLSVDSSKLTRLTIPILINNILTSFTADVEFEISKGEYAFAFEEHLRVGKIFDLVSNLKIKFMYFILSGAAVSLVDNITVSLRTLATEYNSSELIQILYSSETPVISSTVPITATTNVDKTQNIVINFSQSMNEGITNSYIDIEPMFPCNFLWNTSSTQLTLQPQSGTLDASTSYTITIEKSVQTINQATLEEDYVLNFTTGV
jgi:hypothetical protein